MSKYLVIGDPHFKLDNERDTNMLHEKIEALINETKPDIIVVLGDVLHKHEKIDMLAKHRAILFLKMLWKYCSRLYILIGNHDRPNNKAFLTDEHCLSGVELWDHTYVVSKVITHQIGNRNILFVPYVQPGRFEEALKTAGLSYPLEGISAVFSHQEYKGAKMGAIISLEGDVYPTSAPVNFSGHVHDYDQLQHNLYYVGTPYALTFADKPNKTVSMIYFDEKNQYEHKRYNLRIPRKIQIKLTPEQIMSYIPEPDAIIKIKLEGYGAQIKEVMKTDHVKKLNNTPGITISIIDITPSSIDLDLNIKEAKSKQSFSTRLGLVLKSESVDVQRAFMNIFGGEITVSSS